MNKLSIVILIVLVVTVAVLIWQTKSVAPVPVIAGWKTFTDTKQGLTFQYPETLSTTYITAQDWPPIAKTVSSVSPCPVEPFMLNGRSYCVKAQTDAAAGSIYTSYIYSAAVSRIGKTVEISFALRFPQCANYDEPNKTACDNEHKAFNVDGLADEMFSTIR